MYCCLIPKVVLGLFFHILTCDHHGIWSFLIVSLCHDVSAFGT
jgi:hypothetical protein